MTITSYDIKEEDYLLPELIQEIFGPTLDEDDVAYEDLPIKTQAKIDTNLEVLANKLQSLICPSNANPDKNGFWCGGFATSEWIHPQNPVVNPDKEDEKHSANMIFPERSGGTGVFIPLGACSSSTKEFEDQFGKSGVPLSTPINKKYTKCIGDNRKASLKEAPKGTEGNEKESAISVSEE